LLELVYLALKKNLEVHDSNPLSDCVFIIYHFRDLINTPRNVTAAT
jgi:hypothetical protein